MLGQVVGMQESMIDDELRRLDNLDEDDLAKIRAKRVQEMKDRQKEEGEWSKQKHGSLTQLTDTKEFFHAAKASKRFVCHFSRPTSHHCVQLNGVLTKLASLHRETRFCFMDAEKAPYICEKLLADPDGNVVIPTVLLCLNGKVVYHVRGLDFIGGEQLSLQRFSTLLQAHGLLIGDGPSNKNDDGENFASFEEYRAHCIRQGFHSASLDDDDDFVDDDFTGDAHDA